MCLQAKPTKVYTKGPLETNKHVILASRELIIVQREREGFLLKSLIIKALGAFNVKARSNSPLVGEKH